MKPTMSVPPAAINSFRKSILRWYDRNRRVLPWRALPGVQADPYRVWLSEIMLQQTVVAAVIPYFLKFTERWPTVRDLAAARQEDVMDAWAGLGYYARARNMLKCAQAVANERGGVFPDTEEGLKDLPGIGDYTAAAVAAIAYDRPATVVDGNVERVVARWFGIEDPLPAAKKIIRAKAGVLSDGRTDRPGDFAQAMMDLGATVCIPKAPRCGSCPVADGCAARAAGNAADLPRRAIKAAKPQRRGYIYWITDGRGRVLLQRRSDDVMLGGTTGLPTSEWATGKPAHPAWARGAKPDKKRSIRHSFTHFDLTLEGCIIKKQAVPDGQGFFWSEYGEIGAVRFPTLFKKFVSLMLHDGRAGEVK